MTGKEGKKAVQSWWEHHPMTYDWDDERESQEGSAAFFRDLDREFRRAAWFGQKRDAPLLDPFIPYKDLASKRVLVVGCGAGTITELLARAGARVTAIDLTSRAVTLTGRRLDLFDGSADVIRSDAEDLPFGDSSFDFVWSWGVIHHTPNTWLAVDEIHRVLREGGQTRVMVYHRHSVKYWLYTVLLKGILGLELLHLSRQELLNRYSDGHIAQYFSRSEAIELFRKFSDIEVLVRGQRSEALPKLHRRIDVGEHWFDPVVRIVTDNFGVFLIVCATK